MADLISYEYWFSTPNQGGEKHKSTYVFNGLIKTLDIPSNGFCVQLGVNTGYTFNLMKQHFGEYRTRGIDLFNVNDDSYVYELNINDIDFNIPIAYAENDIGELKYDPVPRLNAMKWALKNLIPNGILLTTSNVANKQFGEDVDELAKSFNCKTERLDNYNNEYWAKYFNESTIWNTISLMLVTKYT